MDFQELKHTIQKSDISPSYLFAGPELADKLTIIELIKKNLFADEPPVIHTYYCDNEFSSADFMETIETKALFSTNKLIILKNIEQANTRIITLLNSLLIPESIQALLFNQFFANEKKILDFYELKDDRYFRKKIKEADKPKIAELFANKKFCIYGEGVCLILINESNDPIPESISRLFSASQSVMFFEMFDNKKGEWIRSEFKKQQLNIEDKAVSFLLDTIENNKNSLEREIFNISISFKDFITKNGHKPIVTKDFIEEHMYHSKIETPFSLFNTMIKKDLNKAITILNKLYSEEKEAILPGLIWSQRRLVRILDLYENMKSQPFDIFKEMYIMKKKQQDEISLVFGNFSFEHAVHGLRMMTEAEYYVRVMPSDLKLVKLQQLIIDYINGNTHKSFLQGPIQHVQY